ncbi:hypothetical protein KUCAC02_002320, partial [Chaenocephalus aceratus]
GSKGKHGAFWIALGCTHTVGPGIVEYNVKVLNSSTKLTTGPDAWEREQRSPSHLQRLTQGSHRSAHSLLKSICREDDTMHGYQAARDAWGLASFYTREKYSA